MENAIDGLEPKLLWSIFQQICEIPRPSKHEEKILRYLKDFASERNLKYKQDSVGNLVISRPGTNGGENAKIVVIQSHIDMVCEKNSDKVHDFFKDPITMLRNGDWITADGTTLGSDNGIGVAAGLALMDQPISTPLPPIELLLTVDEETGLTGAFGLEGDLIEGRTLLNLDSEDWEEFYVGCAGGGGNDIEFIFDTTNSENTNYGFYKIALTGLRGGHSGVDIHEGRANAIQLLARILRKLIRSGVSICSIEGGDMHNAIPRESFSTLYFDKNNREIVDQIIQGMGDLFKQEFGSIEDSIKISLDSINTSENILTNDSAMKLITLLNLLPHGVIKMSHEVPGLVETSNNIASIRMADGSKFEIHCSTRSSIKGSLDGIRQNITELCDAYGATCKHDEAYPGWKPDLDSEVLKIAKNVYKKMYREFPEISAIHAGLECGVIGEKVEGMDMLSFGPTIKNPHSPDECVQISTVGPFWDFLLKLMEELSKNSASAGI